MAESDPPKPHPLEGADLEKCYDVMMAERAALITAKRETEDELVRTVIRLSSAALLLIPGLLFSDKLKSLNEIPQELRLGSGLFILSLIVALLEQFLSSKAYDRQLKISMAYYQKKSEQTADLAFSSWVRWAQTVAFVLFVLGAAVSAFGLFNASGRATMARGPSPSPPPYNIPDHKDGGRSIPPPAPPPPPKK